MGVGCSMKSLTCHGKAATELTAASSLLQFRAQVLQQLQPCNLDSRILTRFTRFH